ncbi:hypothetical protein [Shewanella sp.]|uniref:hypothetical protein n=1 Tax=Shewanella sp. TaxID=50422 RepID=UPI003D12DED6
MDWHFIFSRSSPQYRVAAFLWLQRRRYEHSPEAAAAQLWQACCHNDLSKVLLGDLCLCHAHSGCHNSEDNEFIARLLSAIDARLIQAGQARR